MLTLGGLSAWLKQAPRSFTEPVTLNAMPDMPDTVVTLTATGGFGEEVEGLFDAATVQVRARAPTGSSAETLAHRLDRFFMDAPVPTSIGGSHVYAMGRVGGPPSFLRRDDRGRTEYVANYWLKIQR